MTFEQWWETITPAEQKVIGKTNAKFVWQEACEACAKVCDDLWQEDKTAYDCREAIRARGQA